MLYCNTGVESLLQFLLIEQGSVTECASDNKCRLVESLDDAVFVAKLTRVSNIPDWGPNYTPSHFVKALIRTAAAPRGGSLRPDAKFTFKGTSPPTIFERIDKVNKCLTTLSLTVFTQRNFVADFLSEEYNFSRKTAFLRFWAPCLGEGSSYVAPKPPSPLRGLEATYNVHLRLIEKRVVTSSVKWTFSLVRVIRLRRYERISIKNRLFLLERGKFYPNVQV